MSDGRRLDGSLLRGGTLAAPVPSVLGVDDMFADRRTFSAPPTNSTFRPPEDLPVSPAADEEYRYKPEYISFYYANRSLNPRLPPPLPAQPTLPGERLAGIGDPADPPFTPTRSLSPAATSRLERAPTPPVSGDVAAPDAKSALDRIQADFPRTPSPVFSLQQLQLLGLKSAPLPLQPTDTATPAPVPPHAVDPGTVPSLEAEMARMGLDGADGSPLTQLSPGSPGSHFGASSATRSPANSTQDFGGLSPRPSSGDGASPFRPPRASPSAADDAAPPAATSAPSAHYAGGYDAYPQQAFNGGYTMAPEFYAGLSPQLLAAHPSPGMSPLPSMTLVGGRVDDGFSLGPAYGAPAPAPEYAGGYPPAPEYGSGYPHEYARGRYAPPRGAHRGGAPPSGAPPAGAYRHPPPPGPGTYPAMPYGAPAPAPARGGWPAAPSGASGGPPGGYYMPYGEPGAPPHHPPPSGYGRGWGGGGGGGGYEAPPGGYHEPYGMAPSGYGHHPVYHAPPPPRGEYGHRGGRRHGGAPRGGVMPGGSSQRGGGGGRDGGSTPGRRGHDNRRHSALEVVMQELNMHAEELTLTHIAGRCFELSQDQHGSRFIQTQLEVATDAAKAVAFEELLPHFLVLFQNVFGNYVAQKFLEHGNDAQRALLGNLLVDHIQELAVQMYGCRVLQKALEVLPRDRITEMVNRLKADVMNCVLDQNGNHVIQKCIEVAPDQVDFLIELFNNQVRTLSAHPYGCRVIQRVLEYCTPKQTDPILSEVLRNAPHLVRDQYGNYVIQHLLNSGDPAQVSHIVKCVKGNMLTLSQHKFASNVVERCLEHGTPDERRALVQEVITPNSAGVVPIAELVKDKFGNYVAQKVLDVAHPDQQDDVVKTVEASLPLKKFSHSTYGKHILLRLNKLKSSSAARRPR